MNNKANDNHTIWKNHTYVKLFISYTISTMGSFFDMIAVMLLFSYVWQSEPWIIALIPVVYAFPHALFSQFAGIYVDKNNKVKIMLIADILTAVLTIILFLISSPWMVLVILLIRSTCTIVHFPSQQALIRKVVDPDLITKAVTLNGAVNQLSKIIGPFLGASIATAFSPKIIFVVYVVALLISACILLTLGNVDSQSDSNKNGSGEKVDSIWKTWREGWYLLFHTKVLFISFCFALIAFTAIQFVDAQYAVLFREVYPNNPSVLGWAMSSAGLGALLIILFLNRLQQVRKYGWYLGSSIVLIGCGFTINGLLEVGFNILWPIIASLIVGIGVGIFSVVHSYILQMESPKGKVGQMSGMYNSLTGIILLAAPITGGILVQWFNVFIIFQVIGVTIVLIGVIGITLEKKLWKSETIHISSDHEELSQVDVG
ncbi:MFS transporter [Ornithinibacillus caprae]|nr:MFS transporter [Ornithinibacillus caprae]